MTEVSKICSFYASDWHLITMLLPHVNKMINEGTKITTIFEEDTDKKIQILLSKLRLKNERQINRINWKKTEKIENKINNILEESIDDNIEIIVYGSKDYIKNVNLYMEKRINEEQGENILRHIKIINCYSIEEINFQNILEEHDGVLNTAGEKKKEVFLESLNKN